MGKARREIGRTIDGAKVYVAVDDMFPDRLTYPDALDADGTIVRSTPALHAAPEEDHDRTA